MKLITVTTVLSVLFGTPIGNSAEIQTRIVGGSITTIDQFPFLVSIRGKGGAHYCGGALLNSEWVLTAAECVDVFLDIVVGGTNRIDETPKFQSKVLNAIRHKGFNQDTYINDIALLKLETPFDDPFFKYIRLEKTYDDKARDVLTVGWGSDNDPEKLTSINLNAIKGKTQSNEQCKKTKDFRDSKRELGNNQICTEYPKNKGPCKTDSGGPNLVGTDGNYTQIGIVSILDFTCAKYPIISTRVSYYYEWIMEHISK